MQPFFWQTWWFRIGVGGLAIAAASLAGIGVARVRLQRRIEDAERQQAVEHERARIARDIHDDLGASLTRLTLLSQTAMTENAAGRSTAPELDAIYNTASELTRSMDEIVWAVNPRHDSLDSLANFLGKFAQEYLQTARSAAGSISRRVCRPLQYQQKCRTTSSSPPRKCLTTA